MPRLQGTKSQGHNNVRRAETMLKELNSIQEIAKNNVMSENDTIRIINSQNVLLHTATYLILCVFN